MRCRYFIVAVAVAALAGMAAGCGDEGDRSGPLAPSAAPSVLGDLAQQATTIGEILANPGFVGQQVQLMGIATTEVAPRALAFTDGTGTITLDFPASSQLPPFDVVIGVDGLVTEGPRIGVVSWERAPAFSCDDIVEVRARFSDPGYVAGNVVGLFLSYRGAPAGIKTLELDWDDGTGADSFDVGPGDSRGDGLFDLEGVVSHEYASVNGPTNKSVRAVLKINGREGGCSRVRDVTVDKGTGPGFAAGGALRVTLNDPVPSGGFFSVSAFVKNPTGRTGDVKLVFSTPDNSSIRTMGGGCNEINADVVECTVPDVGAFEEKAEFVQYDAPEVTKSTEIRGSVTLVGRDVQPVAQYVTTIEP